MGTNSQSQAGIIWLKIALIYLLVGIGIGIGMGAKQNFALAPVHAHVNLLGWATMALAGLIYSVYPHAAQTTLAKLHFWLINLALPVMLIALSCVMLGMLQAAPVLAIAEIFVAAGVLAFAANVFLNLKKA